MLDCLLEPDIDWKEEFHANYDTWIENNCKCHGTWDDCECPSFLEWIGIMQDESDLSFDY